MNHNSPRIGLALVGLSGTCLSLGGCATSSPWSQRGAPAPASYPNSTWIDVQPEVTQTRANPNAATPDASNPTSGQANANASWDQADSGWAFVEAAGNAEPAPVDTPTPTSGGADGPNISSRIYSSVLSLDLPVEKDDSEHGGFTVNIQQVSFAHDGSNFDPMVSRDGQTLLFASTQHRPTADIYMQHVGSRVITRLTDDPAQDVMPALSPDGKRVAFASNRAGSWDIYIMPITGGKAVQVTSDASDDLSPSWSPDGQHLVFSRLGQTSGRWELWVVDVFNTANTQFIGYGLFPEWCPVKGTGYAGADQILFQRSRERGSRTFSIWTLDYSPETQQASNETELISSPDHALINPSWSPDATRIVYAAVPNPDKWTDENRPTTASLWMIGTDGRGQVNLTSGSSIDLMPTWGTNGRVFFVSTRDGIENLWSLDIAPAILAATGEQVSTNETVTSAPSDD
ncbi:MAG: hypothetical protein Kow0022_01030 [Phycisphaerales bacterium]